MRLLLVLSIIAFAPLQAGNVIFVHPDGAGVAPWQAARMISKGPDGELAWDRLPAIAIYRGHLKDNLTSTSNGGATVHAYGVKVPGAAFGTGDSAEAPPVAAGGKPISLMLEARKAGIRTGLINSGSIIEPGTACFVASAKARSDYGEITRAVLESGVDVILSGGEQWMLPEGMIGRHGKPGKRKDGRDLIRQAREQGYTVVFTREELRAVPPTTKKLLGVFAADHTFNDQTVNEPITISGTGIGGNGALVNTSCTAAKIDSGIAGLAVAATGRGSGYSTAPTVVISGTGSGATATASLGVIAASFSIDGGTTQYTAAPTVTITGGNGATATAVLTGGVVSGITITSAGTGFSGAPTIAFTRGTITSPGTNPTGTGNATNFTVGGLQMTAAGSGYTGTPTVTFDGSVATVTPTLSSVTLGANSNIGGTGDLTINAVVAGGTKALTKVGSDTLTLSGSGSNTSSGAGLTTIAGGSGTLLLAKTGSANAIGGGGLTVGSADNNAATVQYTGNSTDMMGAGAVTINGRGILDFNGATDTVGNVAIVSTGATTSNPTPIINTAGGGNLTIGTLAITPVAGFTSMVNSGNGTLTLGGNVTFTAATTGQAQISGNLNLGAATRTFTVGLGTGASQDLLVDAVITDGGNGLIKAGTGRLALTGNNTYTGNTTISAGTVSVGTIGNLGTGASVKIGQGTTTGTLVYTGSGETSNRTINLSGTTGGATIDQSGTGLLKFTSVTTSGAGNKTVTLQGSTSGAGEIQSVFVDYSSTYTTSLTKAGTGFWTLSGNNTYTGSTNINAGELIISSTGSIAKSTSLGFGVTDTTNGLLTINNSSFTFNGTLNLNINSVSITNGEWTLIGGPAFGAGQLAPSSVTSDIAGLTFTNISGVWTGTDSSSRTWSLSQDHGTLEVVPEPSTWGLLAFSLTTVIILRRRRRD